jgi:heme exporter protein CcmD
MKALSEFFDMGGYAVYLWPSYILTFTVVVLNVVWARRLLARAREEARRRLATKTGTEASSAATRAGSAPWSGRATPEGAPRIEGERADARADGEAT